MDNEMENLAARIRKLQALQQSPYQAESKSAKQKVEELLSKNGTTLDELGFFSSYSARISTVHNKDSGPWQERVLKLLTRETGVRVFCSHDGSRNLYSIEGKESSVRTILTLYQNLENRISALSRDFAPCISDLESFRQGIVESLEIKLQQLLQPLRAANPARAKSLKPAKKQESIKEQEEEWDEWYGREENSFHLGRVIGRKIPVNLVLDREA